MCVYVCVYAYVCVFGCVYMSVYISFCAISMDIPDPFLTPLPYPSSLPAAPRGYTLYPHRADVCRCELVTLILLSHVKGSIGVHHL